MLRRRGSGVWRYPISPRDADPIVYVGWIRSTLRRDPEALAALDHSIHLAPDSMRLYLYEVINYTN